jgi:hypothetical protein
VCVLYEVTRSDAVRLRLVRNVKDMVYRQKLHTRELLQQIMEPNVRLRENYGIIKKVTNYLLRHAKLCLQDGWVIVNDNDRNIRTERT